MSSPKSRQDNQDTRQDNQDIRQDNQDVSLAYIKSDISYIKKQVIDITDSLSHSYWSRQEGEVVLGRLKLLEKIVYGVAGVGAALLVAYLTKGH